MKQSDFLLEGKHWPEDYVKTAINMIKLSVLGQQSWYSDEYIRTDVNNIVQEFGPLSHKNSNLGFFSTVIRWFIEYSGTSMQKYQEFLERKLDGIVRDLQIILNDPKLDQIKRNSLKKISFVEFEKIQKSLSDKIKAADTGFSGFQINDYDIIFIESYQQLNKLFGGDKTGYKGQSEWCHTNGSSTYESWTSNGTRFFFVLAKKGWKQIKPSNPETTNAYDEYGTSLIAILVNQVGELLNATLRWNHIIEPSKNRPGTSVDRAFLTFTDISNVVGMDVKNKVLDELKKNGKYSKYGDVVYHDSKKKCCVYEGYFIWVDNNDNEISAPEHIDGNFNCSKHKSLTSLKGAPKEVGGDFGCYECPSLTSLEGVPQEVGRDFDCSNCKSLTSLKGASQKVGGKFDCSNCKSLTSLEGAPKEVDGNFYCSNCGSLTSLDGAPHEVDGDFYCFGCPSLTSLKGAPKEVGGNFDCYKCPSLTSLKGAPKEVGGWFNCSNCGSLTSLEGVPQEVGGDFYCRSCTFLTSLEGVPQEVGGDFNCSNCGSLTSLECAPQEVGGNFYCFECPALTSLKGAPRKVGRSFDCSKCNSTIDAQEKQYRKWLKTNPTTNYLMNQVVNESCINFVDAIRKNDLFRANWLFKAILKDKISSRFSDIRC